MPIPRDQFDKGLGEMGAKILKLLTEHPNEAFDLDEIAAGLGYIQPKDDFGKILLSSFAIIFGIGGELNDLVRKNLVDKKVIQGKDYYSIHKK